MPRLMGGRTRRIDVIGGGISGLATAYSLSKSGRDLEIHVWEKADHPGGLASNFTADGVTLERFYHHLYRRDVALQELIRELGMGDALAWRPASTGAYYFRRPYRLSSPLDLLRFDPLPPLDRVRLGWLALHARMIRDWQELDDITARDYITREAGANVYRVVWEPLLRGKFGSHGDEISAAWLWRKLVDRGASRDSKGQEYLGYVRGGMGRVFEALADRLRAAGHHVHLGVPVTSLNIGTRVESIVTGTGTFATDAVVAATQTPDIAALLPPGEYRDRLLQIRFLGNVCLVLLMKHSLSEFYWTNVVDASAPFVGIVEQTRWADAADVGHRHVAYISAYVTDDDPRMRMSGEEIYESYMPHIRALLPSFDPQVAERVLCWKARYAQPIVSVGYRRLVPPIETPFQNLFVCTMAQIYPHDRQVSNGVEMARETAARVLGAALHSS